MMSAMAVVARGAAGRAVIVTKRSAAAEKNPPVEPEPLNGRFLLLDVAPAISLSFANLSDARFVIFLQTGE